MIVVIIFIVSVLITVYACCVMSGQGDDKADEQYSKLMAEKKEIAGMVEEDDEGAESAVMTDTNRKS